MVRPLFFPGGDIGTLAVNGTVNDLAMCGARAAVSQRRASSWRKGFAIADSARASSPRCSDAAAAAGVRLVTGDTKVVERGKATASIINTAGVGRVIAPTPIAPRQVRPGDAVLLSGDIGRHGIAVMAAREGLGFETAARQRHAPRSRPRCAR